MTGVDQVKKSYMRPRAEKLEFDYADIVTASNWNNGDRGHGVGKGKGCNKIPGHLRPGNNPKTAHPVFGGCELTFEWDDII